KISTGEERPHLQFEISVVRRDELPRNKNSRFVFRNEQFLLDDYVAVDLVTPARPWLVFERLDARGPIRMNYVGVITLRRNRKRIARGFHPRVKTVHEHHSSRWRRSCSQQQRVITASTNSRDRSAGKSAKAVRFEPFGL